MFVALNAGTAAELPCGYWLIVADDDAIACDEAGNADHGPGRRQRRHQLPKVRGRRPRSPPSCWRTAPPHGRRPPTPRSPTTCTTPSATVLAGLTAYDTHAGAVCRHWRARDSTPPRSPRVRVYVAVGADGGFDAVQTGKDGRAGTDPCEGLDRHHGPSAPARQ